MRFRTPALGLLVLDDESLLFSRLIVCWHSGVYPPAHSPHALSLVPSPLLVLLTRWAWLILLSVCTSTFGPRSSHA